MQLPTYPSEASVLPCISSSQDTQMSLLGLILFLDSDLACRYIRCKCLKGNVPRFAAVLTLCSGHWWTLVQNQLGSIKMCQSFVCFHFQAKLGLFGKLRLFWEGFQGHLPPAGQSWTQCHGLPLLLGSLEPWIKHPLDAMGRMAGTVGGEFEHLCLLGMETPVSGLHIERLPLFHRVLSSRS